jgi:transcription elongation factor Elf1
MSNVRIKSISLSMRGDGIEKIRQETIFPYSYGRGRRQDGRHPTAIKFWRKSNTYFGCLNCGNVKKITNLQRVHVEGEANENESKTIVCEHCGQEHYYENDYTNSIIRDLGYVGSETQFSSGVFDPNVSTSKVRKITRKYRLADITFEETCRERIYEIQLVSSEAQFVSLHDAWTEGLLTDEMIDEISTVHKDRVDPMLIKLFEMTREYPSCCAANYFDKLDRAKDIYKNNPKLFPDIMKALDGMDITYKQFEQGYPDYLLPLTKELIEKWNPVRGMNNYYYGKKYTWPKLDDFGMDGIPSVMAVIGYFNSGNISLDNLYNIISKVDAMKNPMFVDCFKKYFMQMETYLNDLESEHQDLKSAVLDPRTYYTEKNRQLFVDDNYDIQDILKIERESKDGVQWMKNMSQLRRVKKSKKP